MLTPHGFFLRALIGDSWEQSFTDNQVAVIKAISLGLDYSTVAGFARLGGLGLPFASSRAAAATTWSWSSFLTSGYVLPITVYALSFYAMTRHADMLIAEDPSGRPSVVQALFNDHTGGKFQN